MRNSNRPSGPGKPAQERRDEAVTQEELDEVTGEPGGTADEPRRVRQAERDAHTKGKDTTAASGTSRNRRG